jgi:SAM-dependent methyltransferase
MSIELDPVWRDLDFMSPLSRRRAAGLAAFLAGTQGLIVDVGCGWAELLLQTIAAAPAATALGIDLDVAAIAHGRSLAAGRGLSRRVALTTDAADSALPARAAAAICVGSTHAWAPPSGDAPEPLHYDRALTRIRSLLPVGGRVVYGEGVWSRPPTPAAIQHLGGREDEMVTLEALIGIASGAGFTVEAADIATQEEWDDFETGYVERFRRWLAEHAADHPDAAEVRERIAHQEDAYHNGYRGVLGFAYLELAAVPW